MSDVEEEFTENSPLGVKKLLAAWVDLSFDKKVLVLNNINNYILAHILEIIKKALTSKNEYIRYLAAKKVLEFQGYFEDDDENEDKEYKKIKAKIKSDKSELVKGTLIEIPFLSGSKTFKNFFTRPHIERLFLVSLIKIYSENEKKIFEDIPNKIKKNIITEFEAYEIVYQFVSNKNIIDSSEGNSYDGLDQHTRGEELKELWNLSLTLPISIAILLIENLPIVRGELSDNSDIFNKFDNDRLTVLVQRKDFKDQDFLLKIAKDKNKNNWLRKSALVNLSLSDKDFEAFILMADEDSEKSIKVSDIIIHAQNLDWHMYAELTRIANKEEKGTHFYQVGDLNSMLETRFIIAKKSSDKFYIRKQILHYKTYNLAKTAVQDGYIKNEEYFDKEFHLSKEIVKNNVWNTYMNFISKIGNSTYSRDNNFIIELDENLDENMALEEHGIFLKNYLD